MDCGQDNGGASISVDSYLEPGNFTPVQEYANHDNVEAANTRVFVLNWTCR